MHGMTHEAQENETQSMMIYRDLLKYGYVSIRHRSCRSGIDKRKIEQIMITIVLIKK